PLRRRPQQGRAGNAAGQRALDVVLGDETADVADLGLELRPAPLALLPGRGQARLELADALLELLHSRPQRLAPGVLRRALLGRRRLACGTGGARGRG